MLRSPRWLRLALLAGLLSGVTRPLVWTPAWAGAPLVDDRCALPLPTRPGGAQALATLETVIVAMHGQLEQAPGSTPVISAHWEDGASVQRLLEIAGPLDAPRRLLTVHCLKVQGGRKPSAMRLNSAIVRSIATLPERPSDTAGMASR